MREDKVILLSKVCDFAVFWNARWVYNNFGQYLGSLSDQFCLNE